MKDVQWVLSNGFISLYEQRGKLFKSLLLLFVLYSILSVAEFMLGYDAASASFYQFLNFVLQSLLLGFVAINIHRILLVSERLRVEPDFLLSKTESNVRYLIRAVWIFIAVSLIVFLVASVFIQLSSLGFSLGLDESSPVSMGLYGVLILVVGLALYYASPIFLVLPCIANQSVMTFSDAFKLGKNYRLLMFSVVIALPMLMQLILTEIISLLFFTPVSFDESQAANVESFSMIEYAFYSVAYFSTTVVSVALLSAAYSRIKSLGELREGML
ncbi:MAG: hypothetical protein ACRBEE_15905 [Arenicella sp.]